ncbi:hypothetical protein Zmor_012173 [Zophobas morio]|uniref:Uncharacterized protein n=1 Tax=Zophobas morio TaxID=2755281 RepID=A0AA38LYD9_9CUCU|nr:hypothetical protein Zmor_012173 [Zophobas morio]
MFFGFSVPKNGHPYLKDDHIYNTLEDGYIKSNILNEEVTKNWDPSQYAENIAKFYELPGAHPVPSRDGNGFNYFGFYNDWNPKLMKEILKWF